MVEKLSKVNGCYFAGNKNGKPGYMAISFPFYVMPIK